MYVNVYVCVCIYVYIGNKMVHIHIYTYAPNKMVHILFAMCMYTLDINKIYPHKRGTEFIVAFCLYESPGPPTPTVKRY